MNILTFDIEEWYIEKFFKGNDPEKYKAYDSTLVRILELLDRHSLKATFFCVGALGEHFPYVVKRIAECGHEIGCHSNVHKWVNLMTDQELREDTRKAIDQLEQCTGKKVKSYRAPAFSIGEVNKQAFQILAECGIENDASIFPGMRDFGGFPSFNGGERPCRISYGGIEINEFPITMGTLPIVNKKIAYSGGGYFRLLPLKFVKSQMKASDYVMCYFHIADLLDFKAKLMTKEEYERYFKQPGTFKNRLTRYFKSNVGRKRTFRGLSSILSSFDFINVEEAAQTAENFPLIKL